MDVRREVGDLIVTEGEGFLTNSSQTASAGIKMTNNGRTFTKHEELGGSDIVTALGDEIVASGAYTWSVHVDKMTNGNVFIGVIDANACVSNLWYIYEAETNVWWIKSPGNEDSNEKSGCRGGPEGGQRFANSAPFGQGDTVTINVDLSVGTIAYQKNGEDFMSSSPQGVTGPLRLLVALDWDTEAVTIAKSGPTNVRAHYY